MENNKSEFIRLLEEHVEIENYISTEFCLAFYNAYSLGGRPREYQLESFIRF
jgi:hypothetical protein